MAKIIQFTPRLHGPRAPFGFYFPAVYRVTGFSFKAPEMTADPAYPYLGYTLAEDRHVGIATPSVTLIRHLDPAIDDGWVIVTRHPDDQEAHAYADGWQDNHPTRSEADLGGDSFGVYQTATGFFTLAHRKAPPNCENHLLIFRLHDPSYMPPGRPAHLDAGEYWYHIVRGDGSVVERGIYGSSDTILFPPDPDEAV